MNRNFCGNNNVMTRGNQRANVNFRVRNELRDEFTVVAILLETSVSDLLKMYMRTEIEKMKDARPVDFERTLKEVREEKEREAIVLSNSRANKSTDLNPPLTPLSELYEMSGKALPEKAEEKRSNGSEKKSRTAKLRKVE
jgi:hypothetical protein